MDMEDGKKAKRAAGYAAAEFIDNGMLVGLGTGSTTAYFIEALGKKCREGLRLSAVATSKASAELAVSLGIPLCEVTTPLAIDITVDGADEIDPAWNMIKGGGGALLREKLIAKASSKLVILADPSKLVDKLGKHPLPVEIVPFLYRNTIKALSEMGYKGKLRPGPYLTDNGNYIFDIQFSGPIIDPQLEHKKIKSLSGVVETGLFFHLAKRVIIGYDNGSVRTIDEPL